MKVLIVGGVAGGATTAARLRRVSENSEIIIFEKGPYVSFANCGLPYHLSGTIRDREQLLVTSADDLRNLLNLDVRTNQEVLSIDRANKTVTVRDLLNQRDYTEPYDKLLLSPGASPIVPPLPGVDREGVFVLHNIPELDDIIAWIKTHQPKNAVVVGGGFIGLEVAENLVELGIKVDLVEMLNQVMAPIDYELAAEVHQHLEMHGINLHLGDGLKAIEKGQNKVLQVNTSSGLALETDLVILSIGVRPNSKLAKDDGLEMEPRGHICVNSHMQTSDPDIYAVGDAVQVDSFLTGKPTFLALAGPASKQARIAADHIAGRDVAFKGVIGTSVVKIFDLTVASTGLNSRQLTEAQIPFDSVTSHVNDHAGYYPGAAPIQFKLLFGPQGQIFGAQAVGTHGVEKRIDVIATAIHGKMTVYDLEELELSYAPPFGSARDPVNVVGFLAGNVLRGDVDVIHWDQIDKLDPDEWAILDVRYPEELSVAALPGAINIPLSELRSRLGELPKEKRFAVICGTGQRSYFALRILRQNGFEAVNVSGGFKTLNFTKKAEPAMKQHETSVPESNQQATQLIVKADYELDACGLQCPGPILKLYKQVNEMKDGDVVTVTATDMGFAADVGAWARSTGNSLLALDVSKGLVTAQVQKGLAQTAQTVGTENLPTPTPGKDLTMVVFSGDLDKAIAAFIIANGFAALGQKATLFFTFWGLNILRKPEPGKVKKNFIERMFGWMMPRGANKTTLSQMHMMGAGTAMIKGIMKKYNVDSLPEMIKTAQENGVRLLACQMSMDLMGIKKEELLDGVEIAGVATMAVSATDSNTHYFI
ncbi:MAG: FAD-dependent oxidoreductase [Anaerolineaceae bacterium]|nr:FAD-dependent oxidoreductase [Anaerolineaceae bacterium]MDD4042496.1 FAD-dependent oxidoreductase [Anaerolineaceae bacterium]MDD4578151.1 FAD-dependent oxidoreductase [Anaerolineaceae bacterium]